jgi:hypothetical protein
LRKLLHLDDERDTAESTVGIRRQRRLRSVALFTSLATARFSITVR